MGRMRSNHRHRQKAKPRSESAREVTWKNLLVLWLRSLRGRIIAVNQNIAAMGTSSQCARFGWGESLVVSPRRHQDEHELALPGLDHRCLLHGQARALPRQLFLRLPLAGPLDTRSDA